MNTPSGIVVSGVVIPLARATTVNRSHLQSLLAACLIALTALALTACAEGSSKKGDPDTTETDTVDVNEDVDVSDVEDTMLPPAPSGPTRAAISSGGGALGSTNYKARISVGSPVASQPTLSSPRFKAQIGVGPFTARPLPAPQP